MKNQKTTKKALLTSALSLVLCLTMLIGTTFAWFTDSVTSANNKIKAGNLKIDLLVKGENGYESVKESQEPIFNYDLWEPGYVMYKNLQVKNEGSLALKYMMRIVATGEVSILADVIDVYLIDGEAQGLTRESLAAMTPAGTVREILAENNGCITGNLFAGNSEFKTIAFKMRETAGNEYQNLSIGSKFDIKLLATQLTNEFDSFNNQYDKDATFITPWDGETTSEPQKDANGVYHITNADELAYLNTILSTLKTEQGIKVQLDNDINLGGYDFTPIGVGTFEGQPFIGTFDGNGYTVYNVNINQNVSTMSARATGLDNVGFFGTAMYEDTVIKNLTLSGVNIAGGERTGALVGSAESITIENCHVANGTVEGSAATNAKVGGMVGILISSTVKNSSVSDVTVISTHTEGIAGGLVGRTQKDGVKPVVRDNKVSNVTVMAATTGEVLGKDLVGIDVSSNTKTDVEVVVKPTQIADGLYQDANGEYLIMSGAGLAYLNVNWKTLTSRYVVINLISDIDFTGYTWTSLDSYIDFGNVLKEFNGNGHKITNLTVNGQGMFKRFAGSGDVAITDVTFENAKVTSSSINTALIVGHTYANVLLDNVDVKNSNITGGYKVATLIGTVYNEGASKIIATLKNCDVDNCVVTTTSYDFMTCGMVAFVYVGDNDELVFENCTISNTKLCNTNSGGYSYHAFVYYTDAETDDCFDEAPGVTVTNCTFESLQ